MLFPAAVKMFDSCLIDAYLSHLFFVFYDEGLFQKLGPPFLSENLSHPFGFPYTIFYFEFPPEIFNI